jgi:hypothetical protein
MPGLAQDAIVDGPTAAADCPPGIWKAEGCRTIKGIVEQATWLESVVDPAHLAQTLYVVEP